VWPLSYILNVLRFCWSRGAYYKVFSFWP